MFSILALRQTSSSDPSSNCVFTIAKHTIPTFGYCSRSFTILSNACSISSSLPWQYNTHQLECNKHTHIHQLTYLLLITVVVVVLIIWPLPVLWCCWLGGRKGIRSVKTEWWGAGMVICLEQGADLHTAQLMPLPLTFSCFSKIQIGFTFLVLSHSGSPRKRAVKRVCVYLIFSYSTGKWLWSTPNVSKNHFRTHKHKYCPFWQN